MRLVIDDDGIEQAIERIGAALPRDILSVSDAWVEPSRCISVKLKAMGKGMKVKVSPIVVSGELVLDIIKLFPMGSRIDFSGLLGYLDDAINKAIPIEGVYMKGSKIYTGVKCIAAGITHDGELLISC